MLATQLWGDDDGVILPYVAIMLAVIIGLSALAFDASRLMSIQTQLQAGADALALALPHYIIQADAAIRNLVTNPVVGRLAMLNFHARCLNH
jgi:Flp pilus assembly protein TadG